MESACLKSEPALTLLSLQVCIGPKGSHDPSNACRTVHGTTVGMTPVLELARELVLWSGLLDHNGVGLTDIGIVNLVGIELQVAFQD